MRARVYKMYLYNIFVLGLIQESSDSRTQGNMENRNKSTVVLQLGRLELTT